jgi:hypothetical protein
MVKCGTAEQRPINGRAQQELGLGRAPGDWTASWRASCHFVLPFNSFIFFKINPLFEYQERKCRKMEDVGATEPWSSRLDESGDESDLEPSPEEEVGPITIVRLPANKTTSCAASVCR